MTSRCPALGHHRRAPPRHALPLRPARHARAPDHPPAPRAALPGGDQQLFAEGHPGRAFRELAAGPQRQLAGALCLSGAGAGVSHRGRSRHRAVDHQPLRLLRRNRCRDLPLRLSGGTQGRTRALSGDRARRPVADRIPRHGGARTDQYGQLHRRPERAARRHDRLWHPHGARRAGAGAHARHQVRILPGHELAAGADPAASRPRGPLRLRLPDPDEGGYRPARGAARHGQGLHRPPRLGGGLYPRRRLDRARSDLGPADRRGPSAARGDAALPLGSAGLRPGELCRDGLRFRHERGARP